MSTVVSPPASPCSTVLPVPSLDPSSTTYTIAPGTARCARETTSAIVAAAWYAGMTTATAASARPGIGRGVPFEDGEDRLELGALLGVPASYLFQPSVMRLGMSLGSYIT